MSKAILCDWPWLPEMEWRIAWLGMWSEIGLAYSVVEHMTRSLRYWMDLGRIALAEGTTPEQAALDHTAQGWEWQKSARTLDVAVRLGGAHEAR